MEFIQFEGLGITGEWDFIYSDLNGNETHRFTRKNLITQSGLNFLASILINEQTNNIPIYLAIGTGTNAPASSDVKLQTESFRKISSALSRQGGMARLRFFLQSNEANGDWNEFGVFAAGTTLTDSGTMINHLVTPISKASNTVLTIEVRLTFAAS